LSLSTLQTTGVKKMRKSLWLMALALGALCAPAALRAGDITYTVDETVGGGSVTGFITTDGNTGTLGSSDIVNWNLVLNDGTNPTFDLNGSNSQEQVIGADLSATATQLLFNFGGTDGGSFDIENPGLSQNGPVICYEAGSSFPFCQNGTPVPPANSIVLDTLLPETDFVYTTGLTGTEVIGSVATPEPASAALVLTGLLGLVGVRRRKIQA